MLLFQVLALVLSMTNSIFSVESTKPAPESEYPTAILDYVRDGTFVPVGTSWTSFRVQKLANGPHAPPEHLWTIMKGDMDITHIQLESMSNFYEAVERHVKSGKVTGKSGRIRLELEIDKTQFYCR